MKKQKQEGDFKRIAGHKIPFTGHGNTLQVFTLTLHVLYVAILPHLQCCPIISE